MIDFFTLFGGNDIPFPELKIIIHQPRLSEISLIGEKAFFNAAHYICLDKRTLPQDQNKLANHSNFQILQEILKSPEIKETKIQIINLLTLLIPTHKVSITPNGFLLYNSNTKETCSIDENTFEAFKEIVNAILCLSNVFQKDNVAYNPGNKRAEEIAKKIMAGRRKVAEIKASENQVSSVLARYASIIATGLKVPIPYIMKEYTLMQLFDQMERFELKTSFDIDLKVRLAGGKPDKEVDDWMKDIHKSK